MAEGKKLYPQFLIALCNKLFGEEREDFNEEKKQKRIGAYDGGRVCSFYNEGGRIRSDTAIVYCQCHIGSKGFRQEGSKRTTEVKRAVCRHQQAAPGHGNQYQPDGACGKWLRTDTAAGTTGAVVPRAAVVPKGV